MVKVGEKIRGRWAEYYSAPTVCIIVGVEDCSTDPHHNLQRI
ncbi:hypothetical protein [Geminocystis sp.]